MLNKNSPLEAWIIVFLEAKAKRKVLQIKVREKAREKRLERS
jgi:heme exporter protein D